MTSELQRLIDGLGQLLQRNVTLDDSRLRQLAFSSHEFGPIDRLRELSILKREVPEGAVDWAFSAGGRNATEPFRPPLAPEIGVTAQRFCVPVRQQDTILGYVWIIEGDDPVTDVELKTILDAIETIVVVMQRDQLAQELHRSRARELVRDLVVTGEPSTREHAAAELIDADLFVGSEPVVVVVVTLHDSERTLPDGERDVLGGWLERISARLSDRRHISLVRRDHGLLLLSEKDPMISGKAVLGMVEELVGNLARDIPDVEPYAGIGEVVDGLPEVYRSYWQAERAANVARLVGGLGRVTPFERLGVYGLLVRIPPDELTLDVLPPGLLRLLEAGTKGEHLASTLEAFLDNAGDAQATAEQLYVHRTTLYYRLQRIEEWTGAHLASGEDRLAYHLGLKIARLVGLRRA